ncbi:MAG TPA: serine/threonine-protein kinase [Xanthomonadaceae bacterium]|nr:serine/threonine-protein kinase [Xanthomonadaceae bacterium]
MVEIPGYRVGRELGRGGMAVVYLAEQLSLRREVALKVLDPELAAGDPSFSHRFLREGRVAAGLHHRHIVAIHDFGVHAGHAYLAMEYLPRGPVTPQAGQMAPREALRCIREIASALSHAHARGIVHRDIKPDNILCHEDDAFLLTDFGIAHVVDASSVLTRENATAGTPAYMAPELWRDGRVDARVDFYALGAVLYQLLTGEPPYRGEDGWAVGMQHMQAPVPQLPAAYRPLQGLLGRLLAKEPLDRLASTAELTAHIDALEREGAVPAQDEAIAPGARAATPRTSRLLREWPFRGGAAAFGGEEAAPAVTERDGGATDPSFGKAPEARWHEPLRAALLPQSAPHVAALLQVQSSRGHSLDETAVRRLLRRFHSREVERDGELLTAEFHSAKEALECALRLLATQGRRLRAALTLGDVAHREGRFVGRAAADAQAVLQHAGPGELAVSSAVQYTVVTPLHRALARHMRPALARDDEAHAWVAPAAEVAKAAAQAFPEARSGLATRRALRFGLLGLLLATVVLAALRWLPRGPAAPGSAVVDAAVYAYHARGRHLLDRGRGPADLDEAIAQFGEALALAPSFSPAQAGICEAQVRRSERSRDTGVLEQARQACALAPDAGSATGDVALAMAEFDRVRGEHALALRGYERALEEPAVRGRAHLGMAQVMAARGDDAAALRHFGLARSLDKGDWFVPYQLGRFHYDRQRFHEAAEAFRYATELAPDDVANAWTNLGAALLLLGRLQEASEALYRSVAIEATHGALNNLAIVRFNLGDYTEAAALFRRAVPLARDFRTRGNLADALSQLPHETEATHREYARAAAEAEAWLQDNPDDARAMATLAWFRANLGEAEAARALLARAEQGGGNEVLVRAAEVHAHLGDLDAARQRVEQALQAGHALETLRALPVLEPVLREMRAGSGTGSPPGGAGTARPDEKTKTNPIEGRQP